MSSVTPRNSLPIPRYHKTGKHSRDSLFCAEEETTSMIWGWGWLVVIFGLIKEEVGGKLFILVAGKVGLDSLVTVKA